MAQPPDISETFLREVDENLRRDRLADFGKKYGTWLAIVVVLFLAASGGWIYWQQLQVRQSEGQVEQLAQIYRNFSAGNLTSGSRQLDALGKSGSEGVRTSALFASAALAIEQSNLKLATEKFREIASDNGVPKPYRDLALVRQTALEFDRLKPKEVISRLEPLAKPGEPWFGSAGEMTAAALIKQGKKDEAARLYASIAKDSTVPDTIRARSAQIAFSLGVDASSALAAPAQ